MPGGHAAKGKRAQIGKNKKHDYFYFNNLDGYPNLYRCFKNTSVLANF